METPRPGQDSIQGTPNHHRELPFIPKGELQRIGVLLTGLSLLAVGIEVDRHEPVGVALGVVCTAISVGLGLIRETTPNSQA